MNWFVEFFAYYGVISFCQSMCVILPFLYGKLKQWNEKHKYNKRMRKGVEAWAKLTPEERSIRQESISKSVNESWKKFFVDPEVKVP